ncbi:GPI-anchored wall transfer protein 1 [Leucosporidium creatinivorum]|uniref:GPI-anchored wall transfer protein n=1 Tax=Leucosporidium creatinivorum TaxID=106004 RepID=A0A1Y2G4D6_9BASI|nr:GPI-anchored wall transfer protein 1 [Leucosporidium creatinivorum]
MRGYKEAKEAFVSGSTGGTVTRINAVCTTAATTYALWTVLAPRLALRTGSPSLRVPAIEFAILVVPLLLSLTALSAHPLALNLVLTTLVLITDRLDLPLASPPLSPKQSKRSAEPLPLGNRLFSQPFVTVYRAHMMLMTVICILAVDFKVFPREFAKAETWGTSLMDIGVGSFVFSLGLISALPLLRSTERTPFVSAVWQSAKKSAGVLALGLVRVIMVKGVEYPEHVSEYGVHWNFFFTMGLLPIFGAALQYLSPLVDFHLMALVISVVHQLALSRTALQDWTLNAERISFLSQNKEGIVSLPGYVAIFLFGIGTGLYVLPPDPYFYEALYLRPKSSDSPEVRRAIEEKRQKAWKPKPGKLANVLGSYAVLWWGAYLTLRYFGGHVSRRVANLPYVIWIAAFNTSFIFLYLLIHTWASSRPLARAAGAPAIFDAFNRNGLVVFLVANLLTGLVNVSIESMYASDSLAMIVLLLYCAGVVGAAWALRTKRLRM